MMNIPSKLIARAVSELSRLPGIGEKTALRLALHLLRQDNERVSAFGEAIVQMRRDIRYCTQCHNVSDEDICSICANPARENHMVCVVESLRDVIAIENTGIYRGVYHVLGGVISPMDGIGPEKLEIDSLMQRIATGSIQEILLALSPTIEGDTTMFYLSKKLQAFPVKLTTISRGIAVGGELEYADEMTLARSIVTRIPYDHSVSSS